MSIDTVRTSLEDQCVSIKASLGCAHALPERRSSSTYLHTDPYINTVSYRDVVFWLAIITTIFCHIWKTSTMVHVENHVPLLLLLFLYTVLYYISCPLSFREYWLYYSLLVKSEQTSFYGSSSSECLQMLKL